MADPDQKLVIDGTFELPIYKSRMVFGEAESQLNIDYCFDRPNWWWRLWYYLLLGIRWVKIGK